MKHINIYNTTEEYNASKSELYTLEHFVAYNKETNEILTKDIVNITFNITPEDVTINYSIDNENYDQVASNGVPIQVTYKSTLYYKISKSGYSDISGMFFANSDSTITYTLSKVANVGDVIIYKDGEFFAVNPNELTNEGTPIGIVAIPSSHNVYGDGSCCIIGLDRQSCIAGANIEYFDTLYPNVGYISDIDRLVDHFVGHDYYTYIPTDSNTVEGILSLDGIRKYKYDYSRRLGSSPYNSDGSKNSLYYSTSNSNATGDINGKANTELLASFPEQDGYNTEAAQYCYSYSTVGTSEKEWFLPSIGELGHLLANYQAITNGITKINEVYQKNINIFPDYTTFVSSTQCDYDNFWMACVYDFRIDSDSGYNTQSDNYYAIPFLKLKL